MFKTLLLLGALCNFAISQSTPDDASADGFWAPTKVAAAWYAGWHQSEFPLDKVSWSKYTHMTYAFAETTPSLAGLNETGLTGLPAFVNEAHKHGVKALASIGGWTGSPGFSFNLATPSNRTIFVKAVTNLAVKFKLDGLDFDWEFPNGLGIGCNSINPNDTANFLLFLQELRKDPIGKILFLTAAVGINPWVDANGNPLTDVGGFSKVLNYVAIMNYDVWGSWSDTVGPNAPLDDSCAPPSAQVGSAKSAIKAWKDAKFPASQIVLGIPSYGHSFRVRRQDAYLNGSTTQLALYPPFDKNDPPAGDKWDDAPGGVDICGVKQTQFGGNVDYWGMVDLGYLDSNGKPKDGRPYLFDNCSQTAYSYNPEQEIMISYDDPTSTFAKGKFIKDNGLRGFATWEAGGDYKDLLLNAARKGAGFDNYDFCPSPYFPPPHFGSYPFTTNRWMKKPFTNSQKKLVQ
ncbi:chitinase [Crepidotus variabilis]|uniref:Chitinase n=1 Tax=Crepidotus variabilis TaxID=179855 RepID=A0A9P6EFL3_9AGAR|nr:chitinase [Crepidotus variabilis]